MDRRRSRQAVRELYDRIGADFARTRTSPWTEVVDFVSAAGRVGRAADLGCGNGRHLPQLQAAADSVLAIDVSRALLRIGREERDGGDVDWLQGDALRLPLRADSVDLVLYIATIHHLPTGEDRVASLDEVARVMAPGALGLVSAWSVSHERFDETAGHDRWVPWTLPSGERLDRFYHIFDREEFEAEVAGSRMDTVRAYESHGNCYAVVRPPE